MFITKQLTANRQGAARAKHIIFIDFLGFFNRNHLLTFTKPLVTNLMYCYTQKADSKYLIVQRKINLRKN